MHDETDAFTEDQVTEINIDKANKRCEVTMADNSGSTQFNVDIGAVCAKESNVVIINGILSDPISKFENPFFTSNPCSSGTATMALTSNAEKTGSIDYTENFIISMVPNSAGGFTVEAGDTVGAGTDGNNHKRKIGTVCLNYPDEAFRTYYQLPA
jgi:hypothetical protein